VVMNTAYVDEIAATLAETGVTASVHPLEELFD
jgi:hypothetical protein